AEHDFFEREHQYATHFDVDVGGDFRMGRRLRLGGILRRIGAEQTSQRRVAQKDRKRPKRIEFLAVVKTHIDVDLYPGSELFAVKIMANFDRVLDTFWNFDVR